MEEVILVDKNDIPIGTMEKLEAHRQGLLHRAFSVFIFNSNHEMLLQKRAADKYHSAGLWTNTCCSHPRPGEDTAAAARRRLREEMGMDTPLQPNTVFTYKTLFDNGLCEHEVDHVYTGFSDADPQPNPAEVGEFRWMKTEAIKEWIKKEPGVFTSWFKIAMMKIF